MYPNRETFKNAPLALVATEVRFSDLARLRQQETRDQIALALESRFPYAHPLEQLQVNLTPAGPQQVQVSGLVLRNEASTESVTFTPDAVTYETTAYSDFEHLLEAVLAACDALLQTGSKPALQRVGLRYVDEIRVPEPVVNVRSWQRWISPSLTGIADVAPEALTPMSSQGITSYDLGDGRGLNVRFAALNGLSVVAPQNLVRRDFPEGPFFVLDFDGFQNFGDGAATPLTRELVRTSLSAVHAPSGATFQRAITDEARQLFRGDLT